MEKVVKKTYEMSEIKKGYFMCWEVCSQAWHESTVELTDETGTRYFKYSKPAGPSDFKLLGQGSNICMGSRLKLIIITKVDDDIKQSINSYNITNSNAATIGHGYNICIEDSKDEDYNDLYINLVGWEKRG